MGVSVKPRRPPSLRLICVMFPDHSSFSVLRETPMAFSRYHFKKLKCYEISLPHPLFLELVILLAALLEIRKKRCEQKKEGKSQGSG